MNENPQDAVKRPVMAIDATVSLRCGGESSATGESRIVAMPSGTFLGVMCSMFAMKWVWTGLAATILFAALAFTVDIRFVAAAAAVPCLIAPAVVGMLYYSHGLRPECFVNRLPHRLRFTSDCIEATVIHKCGETERDEGGKEEEEVSVFAFPLSRIARIDIAPKAIIAVLRPPSPGFVWIPEEAWEEPGSMERIYEQLNDIANRNKE